MNNTAEIIDAIAFATERHKNQFRKGVGKVPYITHPIAVLKLLSKFDETETDLLISALLHDVIEDTTKNEQGIKELSDIILEKFGGNVLLTVLEVSDNKSLPVEERKRLQIIHTPKLSDRAKKLKIADKICNMLDIKNNPPESWSLERRLRYLDWAKEVVAGAKGLNEKLDQYFDQVYDDTYSYLKSKGH
ncbi:MAG: bifunctional (p)ppGpp synthetase/guanosine-3',5'-bis(diphosphate) 3'-pyrophosphohydrolase [Bacteroidales bacterium]|nr:bifunctional (p)ppGpp synthetase/guanosine-3',5'-bis(diphosphate) 3'-pyrophosphohydrolase [Bacteroidales bacterium]